MELQSVSVVENQRKEIKSGSSRVLSIKEMDVEDCTSSPVDNGKQEGGLESQSASLGEHQGKAIESDSSRVSVKELDGKDCISPHEGEGKQRNVQSEKLAEYP